MSKPIMDSAQFLIRQFANRQFFTTLLLAVMLSLVAGCGSSGPPMSKVTGKITFTDGSVPQGMQKVITFSPTADSAAEIRKGASADIQEDGTYDLYSTRPGSGVHYGKYKVTINILGNYRGGSNTKVASQYTDARTTPLERVVDQPRHEFNFEIEKAP